MYAFDSYFPREPDLLILVDFLRDDYHYLKYYARAYRSDLSAFTTYTNSIAILDSLLAAKSHSFPAIASAMVIVNSIIQETSTHTSFCQRFGVSDQQLESAHESSVTIAYGCFLMDAGLRGTGLLDASHVMVHLLILSHYR